MKFGTISPAQKKILSYVTLGAVIVAALFLWRYFSLLVIAVILAYLFYPLNRRLQPKLGINGAAITTLLVSILVVVIPVVLIVLLAISQLKGFTTDIASGLNNIDFDAISDEVISTYNNLMASLPFGESYSISKDSAVGWLTSALEAFGSFLLSFLSSTVGSAIGLISTSIIYIYVLFSLLKRGPELVRMAKNLNPLGQGISDLYVSKAAAMVRGTVMGQFVIALVQGLLGALTVSIFTDMQLFFVLFIIFTALSVIPLGAGILIMPIGIVMVLFGNIVGGIIVLLGHLVINTNVDNILRPILVPKQARLDPALMLLSVFAGIALFGFLGIVIGPVLMILIVTTIQIYLSVRSNVTPEKVLPNKKAESVA